MCNIFCKLTIVGLGDLVDYFAVLSLNLMVTVEMSRWLRSCSDSDSDSDSDSLQGQARNRNRNRNITYRVFEYDISPLKSRVYAYTLLGFSFFPFSLKNYFLNNQVIK